MCHFELLQQNNSRHILSKIFGQQELLDSVGYCSSMQVQWGISLLQTNMDTSALLQVSDTKTRQHPKYHTCQPVSKTDTAN